MKRSKVHETCEEIVQYLLLEPSLTFSEDKLEEAVIYYRGMDKRTILNWRNALIKLKFIEKISNRKYRFCHPVLSKLPKEIQTSIYK